MSSRLLPLSLLLLLNCPVAWAQQPEGAEFQVNSYTTGNQQAPAVASDANGNFVVVWSSLGQDGSSAGVFGQRFGASGIPQGSEFQINSYTTGDQINPAVASDANGNFLVVWESGQDGSISGVFGQRFNSSGIPLGGEFQVNSYTTGNQQAPAVGSDANGNFVVVWASDGEDGNISGVFGQRFNASGFPQGGEFQVNSYTTGNQQTPAVASEANGKFIVVWGSDDQDGSFSGVFGQRFNASGIPQGSEFQVNSYTTGNQQTPAVASDTNGNFVIVWGSDAQDGSASGVFGQRFNASGFPQGSEFQVNSYTTGNQLTPAVVSAANGNVIVAWESDDQDGNLAGVFSQRFNASGIPQGGEFQVNSYTTGNQQAPTVASDANGNFVVTWESFPQDGSGLGVFGQRYGSVTVTTNPAGLSVTVDGVSHTAPQTFTSWTPGSLHTIAAPSPQGSGATRYLFAAWSDAGAQSHTIATPVSTTTYAATFTTQHLLTTAVALPGGGSVGANPSSADGFYNAGTSVQLTATATAGYTFSGWSGDLTGATNPQNILLSAPLSVTASFTLNGYLLTVTKAGTGTGTVTSNPAGINCGVDCTETYSHGTSVTLTAAADASSTFAAWSGGGCSGTGTCVVSMTAAATVTATFTLKTHGLPPSFTDEPLQSKTTPVKGVHFMELRQAIDALRARAGLAAATWTDVPLTAGVTSVKAVHLTELRTALNAVYAVAGQTAPTYTRAVITGRATVISAVDVAELRVAILGVW